MKVLILAFLIPLGVKAGELKCLAQVIYREARGEPLAGKRAVAQATLNRVWSPKYPNSICKVLHQPGQFQWTKRYKTTLPDIESYRIARDVLLNPDFSFKATHFHSKKVNPKWRLRKVAVIGNHVFYSL